MEREARVSAPLFLCVCIVERVLQNSECRRVGYVAEVERERTARVK